MSHGDDSGVYEMRGGLLEGSGAQVQEVIDWLRHRFGLPCQQPVSGHPFKALAWDNRCGYLAHPQANRCFKPERCHG